MSPSWILMERMTGGGGDNWSYKTHKAPVNKPTPSFYWPDALPVAQLTMSKAL